MKSKNIWLIIISVIILAFDITMGFILNAYSLKITAQNALILYIISKCISIIVFIAVIVAGIFNKNTANYIVQYIATLVLQFVPLIIRYVSISDSGFIVSIILFFVTLIIYCGIVLGFSVLSNRTAKIDKLLEGNKISVKKDDEPKQ